MNLLDIFEGREPHQQAIDRLEQARIAHLEEKMDYYAKHGMAAEFKKAKAERDSYLKVQDECMGYGTLVGEGQMKQMMHKDAERMSREAFCEKYGNEEWVCEFWDNVNGPLDEAGIGQDIVNKTEKMARATPSTPASKVSSTVKNAAKWLAGKGGPGKEGPTYESAQKKNSEEVDEGWSDAVVAQRTGRPRTPYSVYIKGKKWKDFENDDHAEAVANKLRAKFKADGRDPSVITIAATDYDKGMTEADETSWTANSAKFRQEEDMSWPVEITLEPRADVNKGRGRQVKTMTVTGQSRDAAKKKLVDYYRKNGWAVTGIKFTGDLDEGSFAHDQLKGEINDLFKPVVLQIVKWARAEGMTAKDLAGTSSHFFLDALDPDTYDRTQHLPDNYFNKLMDKANAKAVDILKKKGVAEGSKKPDPADNPEYYRYYQELEPKKQTPVKKHKSQDPDPIENPEYYRKEQGVAEAGMGMWGDKGHNAKSQATRDLERSRNEKKQAAERARAEEQDRAWWKTQGKKDVDEASTDYSKRRQREKDVDAGKPVAKQRQSKMTDYQKRRAQQKKDMELGEDYNNETRDAVESAIIRRIMVARTDLLKKFGPQKVMDAAQAVADEHSDVEEIGTSDVSAFVQQVERYLAMNY